MRSGGVSTDDVVRRRHGRSARLRPSGVHYGATDQFGSTAVEDRVGVHDIHATILHLLGIDHEKLTYRFNGQDYRLTDLTGNLIREVLA